MNSHGQRTRYDRVVDEHERVAVGENAPLQATSDPFLAPRADLNRAPACECPVRPSFGLTAVLIIAQLALVAGIGIFSAAFTATPWIVVSSWPLGALIGAALVGMLESSRRPGVRTVVSRTHLAFSSPLMWAALGMSIFVVRGVSLPSSGLRLYWFGAALTTTIVGLMHFGVTLLSLWLGSQADFTNNERAPD